MASDTGFYRAPVTEYPATRSLAAVKGFTIRWRNRTHSFLFSDLGVFPTHNEAWNDDQNGLIEFTGHTMPNICIHKDMTKSGLRRVWISKLDRKPFYTELVIGMIR